jgi:outer membrane protein assembly factor BamB
MDLIRRMPTSPRLVSLAVVAGLSASCTSPSVTEPSSSFTAASPSATASPSPDAGGAWLTYQHDAGRSGVGTAGAGGNTLQLAWRSPSLDGAVYAQPLVMDGRLIVATENDSIYALSAEDGTVLWRAHVGTPVPRSSLPCGNIDPTGITGTPVIDASANLVFAVAFEQPGIHELVGVDALTGRIRVRRKVDALGSDPLVQQQRGALTLANGRVYVPYGGLFGDCGPYHGFVVAVSNDGRGPLRSYRVPTGRAGGIWAPSGLTVGPQGDLYAATGNSDSSGPFDFGDSVIRLSPGLHPLDSFAPPNWAALNTGDVDLGSVGPTLLPGGLAFQIGKEGVGYVLRARDLGGIGGQVGSAPVCSGAFGATAHDDSSIFVPCVDGLVAVRVRPDRTLAIAWRGPSFDAGPPVIADDTVWSLDLGSGTLYGFDEATGRVVARASTGPVAHFSAPSVVGGRIYVAATARVISFRAT